MKTTRLNSNLGIQHESQRQTLQGLKWRCLLLGRWQTNIHFAKMANQKHIVTTTTTTTTESVWEAISVHWNGFCWSCENQDSWQSTGTQYMCTRFQTNCPNANTGWTIQHMRSALIRTHALTSRPPRHPTPPHTHPKTLAMLSGPQEIIFTTVASFWRYWLYNGVKLPGNNKSLRSRWT